MNHASDICDYDPNYYYDIPYVNERDYSARYPVEYWDGNRIVYAHMPLGGAYVPVDYRCHACQFFVRSRVGLLDQTFMGVADNVTCVWEDYPNSTIVLHIKCKRERG